MSDISIKFTPTALVSRGLIYANACPAGQNTGRVVGLATLHSTTSFLQSTMAPATFNPLAKVLGRVSVTPILHGFMRGGLAEKTTSCWAGMRKRLMVRPAIINGGR